MKRTPAGRSQPAPRGIRVAVFISDIHAGSTVAVMPPKVTLAEGTEVRQNKLQAWFWERWLDMQVWLDDELGGAPFALILNGDLIEGDHHRTDQIVSRNIGDHLAIAEEVLAPIASRAAKVFITRGTECHVGDAEAALAHKFGAEKDPETGRQVFDRLTLDLCGVRTVARHHVTTSSRPWLESNGLGIELAAEQLNAARNGEPIPRILAVAHRHTPGDVQTTEGLCFATPAWQGLTRHGHKVVGSARCKPGAYLLDWRSVPDGQMPIVRRRIYEAPKAAAIHV
jgi:hypothetical protein